MRLGINFAIIVLASCASTSLATPIQWPSSAGGNNHYYDFVYAPNITWTDADAAVQSLTYDGLQGYLATITSAAENTFVFTNFSAEAGPFQEGWLGGYQDTSAPDYSEPAGGWRWVTGEPWSYTNWATNEPDNDGGNQNYLRGGSSWDDMQNDPSNPSVQYVSGYFVEYSAPVPEPASGLVLVMSAGMIALGRRRRITRFGRGC